MSAQTILLMLITCLWHHYFFCFTHLGYSLSFIFVFLRHKGLPPPSRGKVGKNRSTRIILVNMSENKKTKWKCWKKFFTQFLGVCNTQKLVIMHNKLASFSPVNNWRKKSEHKLSVPWKVKLKIRRIQIANYFDCMKKTA